ncbi:MAG: 2,3-diphosphoglycerate-dependent phosphoglycerate mutase [Methyloceanibacter sp.]|nr:2,3-diphosphoglycerate-dependent phosphoglycerate mutase [Methyloceanibacter sp.]
MPRLILLRHGQSVWNRDAVFTGWTDVDLCDNGIDEAKHAAQLLRNHDIQFDRCFTSYLHRAIHTLWIVLEELDKSWLPVERNWRLNERHYGALQGRNRDVVKEEVGADQLHVWRRSYAVQPPPLTKDDPRFPGNQSKYADVPGRHLPLTESLKDTVARVLPFWQERVEPLMMKGCTPLIAAHGNSLRGLIKYLDGISDEDIPSLEVPTGKPLVYDLDDDLRTVRSFYLEDGQEAHALPKAKAAPSTA